jgi:hypothetical protein
MSSISGNSRRRNISRGFLPFSKQSEIDQDRKKRI